MTQAFLDCKFQFCLYLLTTFIFIQILTLSIFVRYENYNHKMNLNLFIFIQYYELNPNQSLALMHADRLKTSNIIFFIM